MDAALRPLELAVPQYACLELLGQRPGLSNAELARGAFVTRQSMNGVLRGLPERGLVTRPASVAVRAVERRMLTPLTSAEQRRLHGDLAACAAALSPES
ncbi:MarR family transcriptional regulator [Crossiella sp. SN42]|uniref:MarR family transcriptional regulator n=1 Tax=Crossiella sp. SN42 TaxID=2944808 RepID=UPI00207CE0DC|nr:MarR family transcriptional regulator [Crossiella sp. SN42]MCO1578975.1 MarR family transcriptional regulator [Crossiella sp. SN42]